MSTLTHSQKQDYVFEILKPIMADRRASEGEVKRLYQIFAGLECEPDIRKNVIEAIFADPKSIDTYSPTEDLFTDEEIKLAIAKDWLFIDKLEENDATSTRVSQLLSQLRLTQEQLDFLRDWVAWENAILERLGAGELDLSDATDPAELLSRAAALGIPLTSLYFAGTVGFSAVGLTSGLATLGGMTGLAVLGLNPMTAGIAALIITGISVKKIADFALKRGQKRQIEGQLLEARKTRERFRRFLLQDIESLETTTILEYFSGRSRKRKNIIQTLKQILSADLHEEESAEV